METSIYEKFIPWINTYKVINIYKPSIYGNPPFMRNLWMSLKNCRHSAAPLFPSRSYAEVHHGSQHKRHIGIQDPWPQRNELFIFGHFDAAQSAEFLESSQFHLVGSAPSSTALHAEERLGIGQGQNDAFQVLGIVDVGPLPWKVPDRSQHWKWLALDRTRERLVRPFGIHEFSAQPQAPQISRLFQAFEQDAQGFPGPAAGCDFELLQSTSIRQDFGQLQGFLLVKLASCMGCTNGINADIMELQRLQPGGFLQHLKPHIFSMFDMFFEPQLGHFHRGNEDKPDKPMKFCSKA